MNKCNIVILQKVNFQWSVLRYIAILLLFTQSMLIKGQSDSVNGTSSITIGSSTTIDSLKSQLNRASDDRQLFEVYRSLARKYYTTQVDSVLFYIERAVEIAEKLDDDRLRLRAYIVRGNGYYYVPNYEKALNDYYRSLELAYKLNDIDYIGKSANNISLIYIQQDNLEKAIQYIKEQLPRLKGEVYENAKGLLLGNLSRAYASKEQFDSAHWFGDQAYQIFEKYKFLVK